MTRKKELYKMKTRWKFLHEGMKSEHGNCVWKTGEWKHEDKTEMCSCGFHCSQKINQAFSFVQGEILTKVQVKGKSIINDNKEVWTDMKIIKSWKWQKKNSIALAIYAAELCLDNFEKVYPDDKRPRVAIQAAKKYLKNMTAKNASAADSAADSVARAADSAASAASAAYWAADSAASAAYWAADSAASAADSAASAARAASAADSAASAASAAYWAASAARAASAAIIKKISDWMDKHVAKLEKIT